LSQLAGYWRDANSRTMIVSGEAFEECEAVEAARLKELLDRGGESFRIVLYLRDLAELMPSSYAQMVKLQTQALDIAPERVLGVQPGEVVHLGAVTLFSVPACHGLKAPPATYDFGFAKAAKRHPRDCWPMVCLAVGMCFRNRSAIFRPLRCSLQPLSPRPVPSPSAPPPQKASG
jgi:hypothetical protein